MNDDDRDESRFIGLILACVAVGAALVALWV
jgi:hypothetical protein